MRSLCARRGWVVLIIIAAAVLAQERRGGAPGQPPGGERRGGGRGGPAATVPDDNAGFEALFDGKTLANWDGEPGFWRVEDGCIVGETTAERPLKQNTFLIWRGGSVRDFELKVEFRLTAAANSGVQYRSVVVPEVSQWAMRGYQADMDGANTHTAMVYEERGRGFLAVRGMFNRVAADKTIKQVATLGDQEALKAFIKTGAEWNQIHIIAKGNTLIHVVNGHVMAMLLDEEPEGRAMEGLLGIQLHVGKPMKNEFRSILLKRL
ncbi:MAG: DUF1080 domain-containing protein [Bryobacterales bacterium]|nr:DUF1080 domain-containing protein [Bryobacterales bacterium]